MKILSIEIENFKAISKLALNNLGNTVIIAGQNGCGKSCIFDAIRLLKSAYGGYQHNEWQNWMGEFQINIHQSGSTLSQMFQDKARQLRIKAIFSLEESELAHLRNEATRIITEQAWRQVAPETAGWRSFNAAPLAANLRIHQPTVDKIVETELPVLLEALTRKDHTAELIADSGGSVKVGPSRVLELSFSTLRSRKNWNN